MTPTIDFNQFGIESLPPEHRKPFFMAWIKILLSQLVRLYGILYGFMTYDAVSGTAPDYFDIATNYAKEDEVVYNYQVYKSKVVGNIGNVPDASEDYWELIINNFIGLYERAQYNFQKIVLEWALNHYFHYQIEENGLPGFIQPDDPISPTNSTIYISNAVSEYPSFLISTSDLTSDFIGTDISSGFISTVEDFTSASSYLFIVNIPTLVYTSINSDTDIAEKIVRAFLERYVPTGLFFEIQTY